jgi:bifunctional ADP-heptose synthase (sugar kinase/adenylyltransferase)
MMKVLVVGELCVDRFVYGKVNRMCPEAPVPVLNPIEVIENNGMAGNVVDNLNSLSDDIEVVHWHQNNKLEKIRFVEKKSNHMIVRVDEGETSPIDSFPFMSSEKRNTINESDLVIISDYNKGFLNSSSIKQIASQGGLVLMDSKKKLTEDLIEDITFIKLNEIEYGNNRELADRYPEKFIITLGSGGAKYNGVTYPSTNPQDTIDVSGAGDTFIATFSLKYLKTGDIERSIKFANDACANVVNKKGVAVPDSSFRI